MLTSKLLYVFLLREGDQDKIFFARNFHYIRYCVHPFKAWLSNLVQKSVDECELSQTMISKYVNILGVIQLLEAVTYAPVVGGLLDLTR